MGRTRWIGVAVAVSLVSACDGDEPKTSSTDQAITSENGAWQNGLTSNALFSNGAWQNGAWQNGVLQNGAWQNGAWQNGAWQNGAWQNGAWQNGAWQNGAWQNGAWQNGAWQNGVEGEQLTEWRNGTWTGALWSDEFWQAEARHNLLRDNPYTAKVLQYIYSCAMPSSVHRTLDAGGGITIRLDGGVGLAPTWDTPDGKCDESCQRWVSACVIARTNAYGVTVDISMRVPNNAPEHIKTALAVTPEEAAEYTEREGTFFGNIFATAPVDQTGNVVTEPDPTGAEQQFQNRPLLLACAGPFSNLPDLTKRFVSSQGDGGPVQVLGTCEEHPQHPAVCSGLDRNADGTPRDGAAEAACFGPPMRSDGLRTEYTEVITVYLKKPITKCGNNVCEKGEASDVCPSDCHPGTVAVNLGVSLFGSSNIPWGVQNAASTNDGNVVTGGVVYGPIDLGAGPTDGLHWNFVLAKYTKAGALLWSKAFGTDISGQGFTLASSHDGSIAISVPGFGHDGGWVWRTTSNGDVQAGWPVRLGASGMDIKPIGPAAFDRNGNLYITGYFGGSITIGTQSFTSVHWKDAFITKIDPSGSIAWTRHFWGGDFMNPEGLAIDGAGFAFISYFGNDGGISKLDPATGATVWFKPGEFHALAADSNGDLYASYDRFHAYLLKLSGATSNELARAQVQRICDPQGNPQGPCSSGIVSGMNIVLDNAGNVIMGSSGGGGPRGFDFGAGEFRPYASYDSYLSAYRASDLKFRWAKHIPFILDGGQNALSVDPNGSLTMIGAFSGSMNFDAQVLVNSIPEIGGHPEVFIATMNQPDFSDVTPPTMNDIPNHIVVQATSAAGAQVWYAPPTALDSGNSGVNVVCSPASNSFFAIGDTTVECIAYDPLGNKTGVETFVITVEDNNGPIFAAKAMTATVQPTASGQLKLMYDLPLAFDELVERFVTVTCTPPAGSAYDVGTTVAVTCTAIDGNNNSSSIGFLVTLTETTDPVSGTTSYAAVVSDAIIPKISVNGPGIVEAEGPDGKSVTFTVSTSDLQGIVDTTCTHDSGDVMPVGETFVTCTTKNVAGFTNADTYRVVVRDSTAPTLTIDAPTGTIPATSPDGTLVTFTRTATDIVTLQPSVSCDHESDTPFASGTTLVSCTAVDDAGNRTTKTFTITVDSPPTLTVPTSTVTGTYGSPVTYEVTATDDLPGVTTTCTPPSGSTFGVGTTTVSCTATDSSGQRTTRTFQVEVTLPWSGFLQPINSNGTSIFKQGSTIPVKFQLTGAAATLTNLVATVRVQKVANSVLGSELETVISTSADSGTTFRYDATSNQYIFNLSTSNLSAGTYAVSAWVGSTVIGTVHISIKK